MSYSINKETKVIVEEFEVGDRVDCLGKTNTFIPLKDTTENFKLNPKCRLIISQRAKLVKLVNYWKYKYKSHIIIICEQMPRFRCGNKLVKKYQE